MERLRSIDAKRLNKAFNLISLVLHHYEKSDLELSNGNGSVSEQLSISLCALDTIYQDFEF